ncbi:MAG: spore germination protein [Moorellales bacterium]
MSFLWRSLVGRRPNGSPKRGRKGARLEGRHLYPAVADNLRALEQALGTCDDLVVRRLKLGRLALGVVFIEGLANRSVVEHDLLRSLLDQAEWRRDAGLPLETAVQALQEKTLCVGEVAEVKDLRAAVEAVLNGNTVIFGEGWSAAICACTKGGEKRAIVEPDTEKVIRGPRDGFTEDLRVNTSLLRRRLRSPDLQLETLILGRITRTRVTLVYLRHLAPPSVVDEVRRRLRGIDLDGVLDSGYVEEFLEDHPFSFFPQIARTERPDTTAAALLEGRVAILTDGTPFALILPVNLNFFMQVPEDYYERWLSVIGIRFFRYLGTLLATFLPALYVALTTYHQEFIPTQLAVAIAGQREQVPYPAFIEALFMQVVFEIMIEAGLRLPRAIGQAVSIVGTLVIGEAATRAGMVSAAMVIVIATTALASFTLPSYSVYLSVRMLRLPMIFLAGFLGLFGIFAGLLAVLIHLVSLRSVGLPYLEPLTPLVLSEHKDLLLRVPWWAMLTRLRLARDALRVRPGGQPRPRRMELEAGAVPRHRNFRRVEQPGSGRKR